MERISQHSHAPLPWSHSPGAELVRLAWPITVSMLSYSTMTLVDTLFVSRLGSAALAAVGVGGTMAFTLLCFSMGLLGGVKIVVSQAVGAGRKSETGFYLTTGLGIALVLGLITIGAGQIVAQLLPMITATSESGEYSRIYLSARAFGAPGFLLFVAIREYRYGFGESKWPMWATIIANVANVILDWIFIFHLGLGVAGAAWASVIASTIQFIALALAPPKLRLAIDKKRWKKHALSIWKLGAPSGLQFVLEVGSFAVLTLMIAAMSEIDMASHQIAIQVIHFTFLPGVAVSEASSVLTGQAVGARRDALVKVVGRWSLVLAGGYALFCSAVLALGAPWIVGMFNPSPDMVDKAIALLYVAALFQIPDAANIVARGALRGTGDVRFTAVVGIFTAWILTPPLTWLFGFSMGMGAIGGWIAISAEILIGALIFWHRLEKKGWLKAAERTRIELEATSTQPASA